jgi:hypothetical protein
MACYKAEVEECVRLLSDDHRLNDGMPFSRLGGIFEAFGSKRKAISM